MIYVYDGSFQGLLTVIFDSYKVLEEVKDIVKETEQEDFINDRIKCVTERDKAERVKNSIIKNFSYSFYENIFMVFSSNNEKKEIAIAKTLKKLYVEGFYYIESADDYVVLFRNILKRVLGEIHSYKGLLRFDEKDGLLFAKFSPENDILYYIFNHFKRRLVKTKFIIVDIKRNRGVIYNGVRAEFFDYEMKEDFKIEDDYVDLWRIFYDAIAIKERKNERLRVQNMPKKYWNYLPEINRL
ncbi:TIGR03915 family putative DNA repair protein [Peptoniphilus porci]|uniref:DNA metabolism protein n=1 Tax=Peptoniphilus porci TaxID=2652280 RepID=A0A1U7M136_9FIRM|nr:TIGR03915 family putative DNA repair protein [Peptoniphilus porci]OLR65385.1 DNA metabolism protein [Peptoniphilus porci]